MPQSSPSVLLIRLDAIGDALALTPLLSALRDRDIPVDLVLRAVNAQVFSSRAARATFVAPFAVRSSTRENIAAIEAFGAELRAKRYSHVLVATEDPGGYRLAHAVGAPNRIGFSNGWGKPFKTLWVRTQLTHAIVRSAGLDRSAPHECEVLFELGRDVVGASKPSRDPRRLRPLVLEEAANPSNAIAVQVSDKWERFGIALDEVVRAAQVAREHGTVIAIAAANEAAYARRFTEAGGGEVALFDTLDPWKRAIAGARALVAPDSGAIHVAGMVGTPTVGVFPPIRDFALQTARWAPWAAPYRLVAAQRGWPLDAGRALESLLQRQ